MSGGAWEYVMGNYNGTIQFDVFSKLPDSKYYDKYTSTTATQACSGGVCYGHALSETSGWYNDYADSISSASPWFVRGGYCSDASGAGVFHFTYGIGPGFGSLSFRVVLAAA